MPILTVGSGQQFRTIAAAVAAASPGDVIDVQAGIYTNDFVGIFKNLTLQAIGGAVKMVATVDPPNGKAIIEEGGSGVVVTINGFDISGALVPDGNGAAIRYDGGSLMLNNDYLHNNQNGLLGAPDPAGSITINNSEVAFNGTGDGRTHNLYIGDIANFTLANSYIHDANVGHEIKSRAQNNTIIGNRIFDNNGTSSYSIDLPNAGNADIERNIIQQGPNGENDNIIAYGEEGATNSGTSVLIGDNTFVNDKPPGTGLAILNRTATTITFQDNQVWNLTAGQFSGGPLANAGTTGFLTTRPTLDTSSTWADGIPCFLPGTRIAVPDGEMNVEDLSVGDLVRTIHGVALRIIWIGTGRALASPGRRNAATPIIVRRSALAENVPHRDLHVTKGHALYLDGVLIPVEFLVNHRSIMWDDHAREVRLYHIECEQHDILLANGAAAESYRDDGNRWLFDNWNAGWGLPAKQTCAPVLTGGPIVDAAWRRFLDRAGPRPGIPLTLEPALHLLIDGWRVAPVCRRDLHYVFRLATRPAEIRLVSHAGRPQELGLARDPRPLGVAVRQIGVVQGSRSRVIVADDRRLSEGFHAFEPQANVRWTDGDARLPTGLLEGFNPPIRLIIRLGCTAQYPDFGCVLPEHNRSMSEQPGFCPIV
jgi:hypothetical protein